MPTKRYGTSTPPRRAALSAIFALACVLLAPLAQAQATTQTFNPTGGEQTFRVPAGVTTISVLAIGEAGGKEPFEVRAPGGLPAEVRGEVSVTPGHTLYVEVGSRTFNGGGCLPEPPPSTNCEPNIGGGASDVRTSPRATGLSPDTRLIVAGGGGGGGGKVGGQGAAGAGGNAGEPGKNAPPVAGFATAEGGGAGTLTHGGAGGLGVFGNGMEGTLGMGGRGGIGDPTQLNLPAGGSGGGGYYGGGGGGGGNSPGTGSAAAGGGGGSSLVPAGGSMTVLSAKQCEPQPAMQPPCGLVQFSYTIPLTVTKVEPNHGSPGGGTAVTITGTGLTGATAVKFGSTNAQSFTVNSEASITAVSPKGKGTVDVTVTTPAGTSPTSTADQFTFSKK